LSASASIQVITVMDSFSATGHRLIKSVARVQPSGRMLFVHHGNVWREDAAPRKIRRSRRNRSCERQLGDLRTSTSTGFMLHFFLDFRFQ
jgi:hypothetical protein